jgi:class 3 adenylate cyclase
MKTATGTSRPAGDPLKVERKVLTSKIGVFASLSLLLRGVHNLLLLLMFFIVLAAGLSLFKDIEKYPFFNNIVRYERKIEAPLLAAIRSVVPTKFRGGDIAIWLLLGAVYGFSTASGVAGARLAVRADRLRERRAALDSPDFLLKKAATGEKLRRKELLEVYASAKKSLEAQKRNLAFLSIDVVDSTGMKAGEDAGIAERDFLRYKKIVEAALKANQALKSTWTPDGVMICFAATASAVRAAQEIITGLEKFNREVKAIRRDFAVRAGINAGEVFCDDATPMEEMTDRVIDIAGHMQKHGCVNGIAVPRQAIEPLLAEFKFSDSARVVDGCQVYEWKPGA